MAEGRCRYGCPPSTFSGGRCWNSSNHPSGRGEVLIPVEKPSVYERVKFRLFDMPCCHHQLCWVNPRLPSYCPQCGASVYQQLRFEEGHVVLTDDDAVLEIHKGA